MKTKITKKQVNESGMSLVADIQTLLQHQTPSYYNCGVYGWNWDCYVFYTSGYKTYFVLNGYRNFPSNRVHKDYDFVRGYEEQARQIQNNIAISYEERKEKINSLLKEFLRKVFEDDTILVF
ncbi:MAG: hypothetical protein J6A52_04175 [Bacilli bacterium]|nr:hypothetical protein [Bacilli bacterium]